MKSREIAVVAEQTEIASGIFSLWLETESIAKEAVPGQFVSVYSKDKSRMLRSEEHTSELQSRI